MLLSLALLSEPLVSPSSDKADAATLKTKTHIRIGTAGGRNVKKTETEACTVNMHEHALPAMLGTGSRQYINNVYYQTMEREEHETGKDHEAETRATILFLAILTFLKLCKKEHKEVIGAVHSCAPVRGVPVQQ